MVDIPSNETLAKQIQQEVQKSNTLKNCIYCKHYNKASRDCDATRMKMLPYIRGCNGKYFESNLEYMVDLASRELKAEATEYDKMDNLFALSITAANASSCYFTRVHGMIKTLRDKEQNPTNRRCLYKDMESVQEMQRGMDMIREKMNSLAEIMDEKLEEIDQLYRMYVEPETKKLFTAKGGKFDSKSSDNHLNNSLDICELLIDFTRACIGNEENYNTVHSMLKEMKNNYPYALTGKDSASFRMKGVR